MIVFRGDSMKITIDTKEDSPDDIKRVLKMLEAWIEGHVAAPFNMFGDLSSGSGNNSGTGSTQGPGTDIFSLFGDDSKKSENSGINDKKDDDTPEIIPY